MKSTVVELYYPKTKRHWRKWLEKNHLTKDAVWIIFYKKGSGIPTLETKDAIDQALCFGWIDGKAETIGTQSYRQYFCKRKPNSTWSKINKEKIEKLTLTNQMTKAGFDVIEIAKRNGAWVMLDDVERLVIPTDLEKELKKLDQSKHYFSLLSKSNKRNLLQWIALAKTSITRERRIIEVAENASEKQLPKQFRQKKKDM